MRTEHSETPVPYVWTPTVIDGQDVVMFRSASKESWFGRRRNRAPQFAGRVTLAYLAARAEIQDELHPADDPLIAHFPLSAEVRMYAQYPDESEVKNWAHWQAVSTTMHNYVGNTLRNDTEAQALYEQITAFTRPQL